MLFGLGVFASLSVLTSCKKETPAAPTITFANSENSYFGKDIDDTSRQVTITIDAPADLSAIKIFKVTDAGKSTEKLISDFPSKTQHVFTYTFSILPNSGINKFEVEVTDKENQTTSSYFTFTAYTKAAGDITSYGVKIMGAQFNNGLGSFLSATNGTVYSSADAKTNASLIDFAYCYRGVTSDVTYKAVIGAPSDDAIKTGHSGTTGFSSWSTYNTTMFKVSSLSASDFDAINNDSQMTAITGLTDTHVFDLKENDVVAFKTAAGKYGFFKVKAINVGTTLGKDDIQKYQDGSIEIDVKVQK